MSFLPNGNCIESNQIKRYGFVWLIYFRPILFHLYTLLSFFVYTYNRFHMNQVTLNITYRSYFICLLFSLFLQIHTIDFRYESSPLNITFWLSALLLSNRVKDLGKTNIIYKYTHTENQVYPTGLKLLPNSVFSL